MTRVIMCAVLAGGVFAACSSVKRTAPQSTQWRLPNALPGAYLHLPPMPSPGAAAQSNVLPLQLDAVIRHGAQVELKWDAPDATSAVVLFASQGSRFRKILMTREPSALFAPPSVHGIVRVAVSDGKRWTFADTRI